MLVEIKYSKSYLIYLLIALSLVNIIWCQLSTNKWNQNLQVLTLPGYFSVFIFQFEYFLLCSFVLQSACLRIFCSKHSITFENTFLLRRWFYYVHIFYIKLRLRETFTVINSVTTILLGKTLYKFRTIKW